MLHVLAAALLEDLPALAVNVMHSSLGGLKARFLAAHHI